MNLHRLPLDSSGIMSAAWSSLEDSPAWALLVGGAVAVVLLSMLYDSMTRKYSNLPPGPRNWPVIGAMLAMEPKVHEGFAKLAKRHGPIVYLRLGVQAMVVVSSAEVAEELLKHKDGQFGDKYVPISRSASKYIGFDGRSFPFVDNDAELILRRKLLITEFFSPAKVKTYSELRRREIAVMTEKIFKTLIDSKSAVKVGIKSLVHEMVQNVLFSIAVGQSFDGLSPESHLREFPDLLSDFMRLAMTFNAMDLLPFLTRFDPQRLTKDFEEFEKRQREFYTKLVDDRRRLRKAHLQEGNSKAVNEKTLVDVLLDAQEHGSKSLSDYDIYATIAGVLMAGIDSTSSQTEWIMLELVRHPEMMQRLQAEVDGVVGLYRPVDETDVQSMRFLNAVVMEAIRLHPVAPLTFPHVNNEKTTLGGYTIPARTCVLLNIPCVNRDPKAWNDPLQFNPERFMGAEGEKIKANGTSYNILTFAAGRRGCFGYSLAMVSLLRATATLVHAFDWSLPSGLSHTDLSSEERGSIVINPALDLFLTPKPRVSSNLYKSSKVID